MRAGGKSNHKVLAHLYEPIPDWLTLYVFLGLGDLAFTLAALQLGAVEANPFLNATLSNGLFEFTKISLTLLVLCVGFRTRESRLTEHVMGFANAGMSSLFVYHVASLVAFYF